MFAAALRPRPPCHIHLLGRVRDAHLNLESMPASFGSGGLAHDRALAENGWGLPYESVEALRAAGATSGQVVSLIPVRRDRLPVDQLKMLLLALGGDYSRIADGGRGRPTFSVDSAHTYVLNRLVGDTIREVETFKLKGPKLVATLQQVGV